LKKNSKKNITLKYDLAAIIICLRSPNMAASSY
jgi:hypothetical protein